MKKLGYMNLIFLLILLLLTGCETTRNFTDSITSGGEETLFAQVPPDQRIQVEKAEFDLKVAEERLELAKLKTELADLQEKYAGYDKEVTNKYREEAEVSLDLAKWEAIDRSGLGEKDKNIDNIADLKSKRLKIEAERIKIEAKRETTENKINDLSRQIKELEEKIDNMKMGD
ncbi:MAG: hypothetical protein JSV47_10440 [Deltaproteobacteria bacterium]|jgi:chromosome segregation ATPase/predicted small secreted protein|nr:MAG: hypothetical protein JSV47_10440 [Deltaproteobacteria bacterium]